MRENDRRIDACAGSPLRGRSPIAYIIASQRTFGLWAPLKDLCYKGPYEGLLKKPPPALRSTPITFAPRTLAV